MASTNATLPVETAVIWNDDEEAPDAVVAARAAAAAQRAEARRRAAATPEAAWRLQQDHADDLASAFKELETLVHDADRKRRGSTPADAPTARRDDEADAPAKTDNPTVDAVRDDDAASRPSSATTPDAPTAEAKRDDDDDDSWAEFY
jgi:hypothetical protein